jgi:hypothetical protein
MSVSRHVVLAGSHPGATGRKRDPRDDLGEAELRSRGDPETERLRILFLHQEARNVPHQI